MERRSKHRSVTRILLYSNKIIFYALGIALKLKNQPLNCVGPKIACCKLTLTVACDKLSQNVIIGAMFSRLSIILQRCI